MAAEEMFEEALEMFEAALVLEPDHDPSLYGAAEVLAQSTRPEDLTTALEYSRRAVELDPDNDWYAELRQSLLALLDVRMSRAYYDDDNGELMRLVELRNAQPETDPVRGGMMKMSVQQKAGDLKGARKTAMELLKTARTDSVKSELHGAIGSLWHEQGKDERTFEEYEKALGYNPDNALVLNNYAYYLAVGGTELDRALGMATRAVNSEPDNATYLDTHAWVLYRLGDYPQAKAVMQRALVLDRDGSAELLRHYGEILRALGDDVMAEIYFKRAAGAK